VCACVCVCVCAASRTCGEHLARAQEADGQPHDGGLVQVGGDAVRQRQLVGELVEHVRLFAASGASRVARLLLTSLGAAPARENTNYNSSVCIVTLKKEKKQLVR